eukprot:5617222-Alexandrium_andersonii.AAC.1
MTPLPVGLKQVISASDFTVLTGHMHTFGQCLRVARAAPSATLCGLGSCVCRGIGIEALAPAK